MKTATVVVLFEGEFAEHFVGMMSEYPSQEEQKRIATKLAELDSKGFRQFTVLRLDTAIKSADWC